MDTLSQPWTEEDREAVDRIVRETGAGPDAVVPILQAIQARFRYVPRTALERVCEITAIRPSEISGVSTFYTQFRHTPVGEHLISVCHGTACHVKGAELISKAFRRHLNIPDDDDTDPNGQFTVQKVACIGCCSLAPAILIDGITYGYLTPDTVGKTLNDFLELKRRGALAKPNGDPARRHETGLPEIRVCLDSCCRAGGTKEVYDAIERELIATRAPAAVKRVGCILQCGQAPMIEIAGPDRPPAVYARVPPEDAPAIVRRHFRPRGLWPRMRSAVSNGLESLLTDENWEPVTRYSLDSRDAQVCQFIGPQKHIALEHYGAADPLDLDEYLAGGGFAAARRCLTENRPEQTIEAVVQSGLRGRGGAGFPTGRKWAEVRRAPGEEKRLICNGDEGDPGAFMDRMLLETFPFRVLEGMLIAAHAVGANVGTLYVRAEYPLAVENMRKAMALCAERGWLGANIAGTDFRFDLSLTQGAGAFVCGEETALIASLEGRRGTPKLRPPYPAHRGLQGRPTLINNVETFSMIPWILREGPAAFAAIGTEASRGTKVFALAGKIVRGGLIEVPLGATIRQVVEEIGGGIANGRVFKAVQIGGPSGGCIPASLADTPLDYERLQEHGAIMGSGGLVVLDDADCMVDVARYFLAFTQAESCGQCAYCRIGTRRMLDILERLCGGKGRPGDIERLETLGEQARHGSMCGLGRTAPNPVLTTLRFFRDEYEAHLNGRCPAGKCVALIRYRVTDDCIGCTLCAQRCPAQVIAANPHEKHDIDDTLCTRCDTCRQICPAQAIEIV